MTEVFIFFPEKFFKKFFWKISPKKGLKTAMEHYKYE